MPTVNKRNNDEPDFRYSSGYQVPVSQAPVQGAIDPGTPTVAVREPSGMKQRMSEVARNILDGWDEYYSDPRFGRYAGDLVEEQPGWQVVIDPETGERSIQVLRRRYTNPNFADFFHFDFDPDFERAAPGWLISEPVDVDYHGWTTPEEEFGLRLHGEGEDRDYESYVEDDENWVPSGQTSITARGMTDVDEGHRISQNGWRKIAPTPPSSEEINDWLDAIGASTSNIFSKKNGSE